jgi:ferric-dicitrate binding protein FerR (iron transport regulator)
LHRGPQTLTPAVSSRVLLHDELVTQRDSSIVIVLNGGSKLSLGESSSIIIDEHVFNREGASNSTLIKLLVGKLHSIVPVTERKTNFLVRTGNAICGVRGTDLEVSYIEGKPCPGFPDCLRYTDVGVYRGVVEVRSATNRSAPPVQVSGGYETTVPCEIPPSSPSPLGATEFEAPGYH